MVLSIPNNYKIIFYAGEKNLAAKIARAKANGKCQIYDIFFGVGGGLAR